MLTYRLQDRVFAMQGSSGVQFPADVVIELKFGPATVFGAADAPSGVYVAGRETQLTFKGHTGRVRFQSHPPLEALNVDLDLDTSLLALRGNVLTYARRCESIADLEASVHALYYALPPLLALDFPETPVVESIGGTIAGHPFQWIHRTTQPVFTPVSAEHLEEAFRTAVRRLIAFKGLPHRRLLAALNYFHVSARLRAAGYSEWEFAAEAILNLCKVLEVLFGPTREEVRQQLEHLGYNTEEIEGDFVPILLLRSHLDVGHARLAVPKSEQLQILYEYLQGAEPRFRDLLKRVCERILAGTYVIRDHGLLTLDPSEQSQFDRLVATIGGRLRPQLGEADA